MIRRPPRSTLFPTRRSSDLILRPLLKAWQQSHVGRDGEMRKESDLLNHVPNAAPQLRRCDSVRRSEEHTSELQSRLHLVCRLLLEKKKPSHAVLFVVTFSAS